MQEFDYKLAWRESAKPEFDLLQPCFRNALDIIRIKIEAGSAAKSTADLLNDVRDLIKDQPAYQIARASRTVYYYGHWHHGAEDNPAGGGAYHYFSKAMDALLGEMLGPDVGDLVHEGCIELEDKLHWATTDWRNSPMSSADVWYAVTEKYMRHKEGTEWSLEEYPAKYQELVEQDFEIVACRAVNFKPHPFCIGPKHFPRDGGMYIDPHQAGCAMNVGGKICGLPYEKHTHDRVMFLSCKRNLKNKEAAEALCKLKDALAAANDRLDGFAFIKSDYEIAPPEPEVTQEASKE